MKTGDKVRIIDDEHGRAGEVGTIVGLCSYKDAANAAVWYVEFKSSPAVTVQLAISEDRMVVVPKSHHKIHKLGSRLQNLGESMKRHAVIVEQIDAGVSDGEVTREDCFRLILEDAETVRGISAQITRAAADGICHGR